MTLGFKFQQRSLDPNGNNKNEASSVHVYRFFFFFFNLLIHACMSMLLIRKYNLYWLIGIENLKN